MHPLLQKLVKKADSIVGGIAIKLISKASNKNSGADSRSSSPNLRILIIRPGGLGDAILLTPAVRMLVEKIPSAKIHYVGERRNVEGAEFCYGDVVERFFLYDSVKFVLFLLSNIKKYDIVIDTEQSFLLPAVVAKILGKVVFGFGTTERKDILDVICEYRFFCYEAFEFFRLFGKVVEFVSGEKADEHIGYSDIEKYFKIARDFRGKRFESSDVLVAPFSTKKEKMYPEVHKLVNILKSKFGERVEVLGDKKLSIEEVAYKVMNSKIFISVDNGIMHFRIFSGKPSVAIFGPTNHLKWASSLTNVLRKNLWCSPCSRFAEIPSCPRGEICMKVLAEEILAKVEALKI